MCIILPIWLWSFWHFAADTLDIQLMQPKCHPSFCTTAGERGPFHLVGEFWSSSNLSSTMPPLYAAEFLIQWEAYWGTCFHQHSGPLRKSAEREKKKKKQGQRDVLATCWQDWWQKQSETSTWGLVMSCHTNRFSQYKNIFDTETNIHAGNTLNECYERATDVFG